MTHHACRHPICTLSPHIQKSHAKIFLALRRKGGSKVLQGRETESLLENISQRPIVNLLMVEQPCIIINLLINKIYFRYFHHKFLSSNELRYCDEVFRTI